MQRNPRLSASAGNIHPTWRVSPAVARPASEPGDHADNGGTLTPADPTPLVSDLGSDEDWQLTMGSDSGGECDLSPNEDPPVSPLPTADNGTLTAIRWNNNDEEAFVDDVRNAPLPLPASQPSPLPLQSSSTSAVLSSSLSQPLQQQLEAHAHSHQQHPLAPNAQSQHASTLTNISSPPSPSLVAPAPAAPYASGPDISLSATGAHSPRNVFSTSASTHSYHRRHHSTSVSPRPAPVSVFIPSSAESPLDDLPDQPASAPPIHLPPSSSRTMHDEYDYDDCDQPAVIPGYQGVARLNLSDTAPPRPHVWADRPRGATNSHALPLAPDPSSGQSSPAAHVRLHRAGSDSAVSSQGGSIGSGSALHLSTRTSSEASDQSRRTATKSVSFVTSGVEPLKPPPAASADRAGHVPIAAAPAATPLMPRTPTSAAKAAERKVSGLRMSLRDSKARLASARLAPSKRYQRRALRAAHADAAASQDVVSSELSATLSGHESDVNSPPPPPPPHFEADHGDQVHGEPMQRLSSKSDAGVYARQQSEIATTPVRSERPMSSPQRNQGLLDTISSASGSVMGGGTRTRMFGSTGLGPISGSLSDHRPLPAVMAMHGSNKMSYLECVVEILKSSPVVRRKNFMNSPEAVIWLMSDLQRIRYRVTKRGAAPQTVTVDLSQVRRLKGNERELILEVDSWKKPLDIIFPTRDRADTWFSGLCCLIPSNAVVKPHNKKLERYRQSYDPLNDSWNGKPLSSRKRLKGLILLGSIGRGSFGKVKLALSESDRQFYAVKVLSKAMMRKRIRSAPFDRDAEHDASSSSGQMLGVDDVPEISIMRSLDHENVMKLKGVFDDIEKDQLYIVVEYLAKGPIMSSAKLTDAAFINEDQARVAFVDVLAGLEHLHRNNIVHRDIKPDNLLQAGDGTVKISDFGAAIMYTSEDPDVSEEWHNQGSTVGTPAFTAPELCLSENSPRCPARCFSADIWSLGATLFYMLYGRAPFTQARAVFEMYDAICTQELRFPPTPHVSKSARQLMSELLQKEPQKRAKLPSIVRSEWLSESPDVAEKLLEVRVALQRSATDPGRAGTTQPAPGHGDGVNGNVFRNRVGSKLLSS